MKGSKELERDFIRGVKVIKDKNYNTLCNGITKKSLKFFEYLVKEGYLLVNEVVRAELKFDKKHWYRLILHTSDSYQFEFYGCSFGYMGEGSRGSEKILKECGFTKYKRVFENRNHFEKADSMIFRK